MQYETQRGKLKDCKTSGSENKKYTADGFSFLYLGDWELHVPDFGEGAFIHKLPSAFIKIFVVPHNEFFKSIEERVRELERELSGLGVIFTRDLNIEKMKAEEIRYSSRKNFLIGEMRIVVSSLFIERWDSVFLIDYQALEGKHDEYLHAYEGLKEGLRFIE